MENMENMQFILFFQLLMIQGTEVRGKWEMKSYSATT